MKYDVTKGGYILLGRCGENLARTVEIDVSEYLNEYPGAVVTLLHRRHGERGIYPVAAELRDGCLVWQPTSADTAIVGDGEAEVRVTVNGVLAKSKILSTIVDKSLTGQETDAPEPGMDWVDKITTAIGSVKNMKAEAESVVYGEPATAKYDGKTGTMHFGIPEGRPGRDGTDGKDGAPGAKGDKGDTGSDASVTAENIQSALGYAPVKDVQVAGSSVLEDGVANVPIATKTVNGVMRPDFYGVGVSAKGILYVQNTSNINITNRVPSAPLTAYNLDYAVKAAMCDGKGAAWTSAEQKAARERMGVDKAYELIEDIVLEEGVTKIVRSPLSFPCTSVIACTTLPIMDSPLEYFLQVYTDTNITYVVGKAYGSKHGLVDVRFEESIKNGVLTGTSQGEVHGWGGGTVYGVNNAATLVFCEALIGVRLYTATSGRNIPAGTKIQIYGVRA